MLNGETILDYLNRSLELRKYVMDSYDLEREYLISVACIAGDHK